MSDKTKSSLSMWIDFLERDRRKKAAQLKEFNEKLRKPDHEVVIDEYFAYGYWRIPGGIIMLRKYKNGYHPDNGGEKYTDEDLELLRKLHSQVPREWDDKSGD